VTDPTFETWAEVEAWRTRKKLTGLKQVRRGNCGDAAIIAARIRRVVAAHQHLKDTDNG
jgi:hypothetical protein